MKKKLLATLLTVALLTPLPAHTASAGGSYDECLLEKLQTLPAETPISQVKAACAAEREKKLGAVDRRIAFERKNATNPFAITPHKPNYILLGSYNGSPNGTPLGVDSEELDHTEIKFQVSLKIPLVRNLVGDGNGFLYAAYTAKSFWQAYNDDISSPFRETNHEPEIFFAYRNDKELFGWKSTHILAGFSHQSNGRGGLLSRSWNRLYLDLIFEKGPFALSIKPWYRIPQSDKLYPGDPRGDDNPDITKFMGYGELSGAYRWGGNTVSLMLRNNLRFDHNKGAVEIGWSFPLPWVDYDKGHTLKGYAQYFNGYGESLIDYNTSVNRFGLGVLLTDWL